ncbi:MAG TPA: 2-oxo acid dehydrogenase subunit E2 [Vicinamibacteria bacterium]|nr:2-oxo acid dehydrogenase subunit E2 [Vicinamibacteria bacterium]
MTTPVVMPQMGESLSEGTITKWYKKSGERIERDEPLFEITTDKVDTEVPAPVSGVLERILVADGETVEVGTVVALIAEAEAKASGDTSGHFRGSHEPKTFQRKTPARTTSERIESPPKFSPAVRSLASELGVSLRELDRLRGGGRSGRVTKRDVERYAASRAEAGASRYAYQPEAEDELVPMSEIRRQIAEHMVLSQQISAQVTSFSECDIHRIARYRDEHAAAFEQAEGVPLTFLPFVAEATVRALKAFPIFNASVVGDQIALKKRIHLGIAITLDEGVIVPVVHNAEEQSFIGLAHSIHRLSEKARRPGLAPTDVRGATFTISSPGMFGGLMGTPMIAQPQVAILGLGAVQKKPVVVDDAIAIRPIMVLALTFDHRIIDGSTGFRFLEHVRTLLENFEHPER